MGKSAPSRPALEYGALGPKETFQFTDGAGKIIFSDADLWDAVNALYAILANPGSPGVFGSLDQSLGPNILTDSGSPGRVLLQAAGPTGIFDLLLAAGNNASLTARLAAGDVKPAGVGLENLRWMRRLGRLLKSPVAGDAAVTQLVINIFGDSYEQAASRWSNRYAKAIQAEWGNAGDGWTSFAWYGGGAGPWAYGASQPTGQDGNVRLDLNAYPTFNGAWTATYNAAATNCPSLSSITSSTAANSVRWPFQAGHSSANLYYAGDGTGVVQVSWDDGATWSANINLATVGAAYVAITGSLGAGAGFGRVKVISGNVTLAGVFMKGSASGVIVNKLAGSGATTTQFAGVTPATWAAVVGSMGAQVQIFDAMATNDQGAGTTPAAFKALCATVCANLQLANPASDMWLSSPCENARTTNVYAMPLYAQQLRALAVANSYAFTDDQPFFGPAANRAVAYDDLSVAPLLSPDKLHPSPAQGGPLMADIKIKTTLNGVAA
jgi:hypothetical protein